MKLNDRNLRTPSRILMALPIAALAFSLAACGGAVERPSAEEVSDGLQKVLEDQGMGDTLTEPVILCLSEALVDSEVSNESLDAIAKGDSSAQTDEDEGALVQKTITDAAQDCATAE
ncbi:hypothetical protein J7E68_05625 [Microbacterium sp. ISL-103]|jgi:predicted small lipoprotein YifL|uniref:hypothetical protein n=1 Tax=Microbacterium sp. ISL-103 TaxID=2819156 RepID=UPI001BE67589|nr:hypothetical protein [Microbacterium sp. ISL-103]MBT2474065.1 hypothetical protein [Microbacterium sp. ISL-103]